MALVPMGAAFALLEGNVLGFAGKWIAKLPTDYLRKPLGTCPRCMVSTWGTLALWVCDMLPAWYLLPVYWLAACGLMELRDQLA